jgi:hypothetical protein
MPFSLRRQPLAGITPGSWLLSAISHWLHSHIPVYWPTYITEANISHCIEFRIEDYNTTKV